jgi:hypothetical protein
MKIFQYKFGRRVPEPETAGRAFTGLETPYRPNLIGGTMSHTPAPRHRGLIKSAAFTAAEINYNTMGGFKITPDEATIMLSILTKHDGSTLTPERDFQGRKEVSRMFDKLRFHLREVSES